MAENLYEASRQWAERPEDERFWTLEEMFTRTYAYAQSAQEYSKQFSDIRVLAGAHDLAITAGKSEARLTHHAFGQLSRLVGAPASYLRALPTSLAAECINTGIEKTEDRSINLLMHKNGSMVARAITTENYDRVWNYRVVNQVQKRLIPEGWRVPPARPVRPGQQGARKATQEDCLTRSRGFWGSINPGDLIAPAGLYASDHDMFMFLVNENETIENGGSNLARGVFIKNSEVGDGALWFTLFLYDDVCSNHIVWGARDVMRHRVAHKKSAALERGNTLRNAVYGWDDTLKAMPSKTELDTQIKMARKCILGATEDDAIDEAYKWAKGRNLSRLTKTVLVDGYSTAEQNTRYGSPRTVWGLVNGITQNSQTTGYTDDRNELDLQAGRLMEMAF